MNNFKKLFFGIILFIQFFFLIGIVCPQDDVKLCDNYKSFLKEIINQRPAAIKKISWLKEFSLIEKSLITVTYVTSPDTGYKVTFLITDLKKGEEKDVPYSDSIGSGSVLGYMLEGCKKVESDYEMFINTSCWLIADNSMDAFNVAEEGIDKTFDEKYLIEGDLVQVYEKICKTDPIKPKPKKKPAVYLYPVEKMNVIVKVEINGCLTKTDPPYNEGWNVYATPEGLIDGKYDYLFYESNLNKLELPDEGWVVEFKDIEKWFDEHLPLLGLNTKEKEQFKEYWLKDLRKAKYYEIKLLGNKFLEENEKLVISPDPQTLIRLDFYFKPVSVKREMKEPMINKVERKGFTVVEWGGINEGDLKIIP